MSHITKTYLLETEYTNYNVQIKYKGAQLNPSTKFSNETEEIKYLYDSARSFEILVGGTDYCSNISVFSKRDTTASINKLEYNKKCNITEDLESGVGTRHLLNTSMNFVLAIFPHVTTFILNDASTKDCDKTKKHSVSLIHYYLVFYGETWYSKIFHAHLKRDTEHYKILQLFLTKLRDSSNKKPYIEFYNLFLRDPNIQKQIIKYDIENMYNSSNNYNEFFSRLKDNISDKTELCIFVSHFLTQFVNSIFDFSSLAFADWYINKDTVVKIEINLPIKPFVSQYGGKKTKYQTFLKLF